MLILFQTPVTILNSSFIENSIGQYKSLFPRFPGITTSATETEGRQSSMPTDVEALSDSQLQPILQAIYAEIQVAVKQAADR